jgi:hypothetical protein
MSPKIQGRDESIVKKRHRNSKGSEPRCVAGGVSRCHAHASRQRIVIAQIAILAAA